MSCKIKNTTIIDLDKVAGKINSNQVKTLDIEKSKLNPNTSNILSWRRQKCKLKVKRYSKFNKNETNDNC